MTAQSNAPIIIKRKKIIAAGHHGGAWKVPYADFVTAMMAFFLLMWLLGQQTKSSELSFAVAIFLPVAIWFWVSVRFRLMVRRFCRATIALVFVRILAIWLSPILGGFPPRFGNVIQTYEAILTIAHTAPRATRAIRKMLGELQMKILIRSQCLCRSVLQPSKILDKFYRR